MTNLPSAALLPLEDCELSQLTEVSQFSQIEEDMSQDSSHYGGRDRRISSSRSEGDLGGEEKLPHFEICLFCRKIRRKKATGDDDLDGEFMSIVCVSK